MDWKTIVAFAVWFCGAVICYFVMRNWFSENKRHERNMFVFCVSSWPICLLMMVLILFLNWIKKRRGNDEDL